ncbi:hypothetical protein ANCCAN_23456, partial [Ancylostoma caninum]
LPCFSFRPNQVLSHLWLSWSSSVVSNVLPCWDFSPFHNLNLFLSDKWESFLHPRSCLIKAEQRGTTCRASHVDLFGYYAGRKVVSEGWLQYDDENQILLRLHGNAIKFYKSAKERKNCTVKINPMDVRRRLRSGAQINFSYGVDEEDDEDDNTAPPYPSHSSISVAVLSDKNPKFKNQPDVGITFNNNKDYIVYKTHSVAVEFLVVMIR